jgi:hypothetical protein
MASVPVYVVEFGRIADEMFNPRIFAGFGEFLCRAPLERVEIWRLGFERCLRASDVVIANWP